MSKSKDSEPERVLGVGAVGDINDPERRPTVAEQEAMVAEAAEEPTTTKKKKEEVTDG